MGWGWDSREHEPPVSLRLIKKDDGGKRFIRDRHRPRAQTKQTPSVLLCYEDLSPFCFIIHVSLFLYTLPLLPPTDGEESEGGGASPGIRNGRARPLVLVLCAGL
ncbi:unnamed protein product [Arctogadus glacialis]